MNVCVKKWIYGCVYMNVCIHMSTCGLCEYRCVNTLDVNMDICEYGCVHGLCIDMCKDMYIYECVYIWMYIQMCLHVDFMCVNIGVCMDVYVYEHVYGYVTCVWMYMRAHTTTETHLSLSLFTETDAGSLLCSQLFLLAGTFWRWLSPVRTRGCVVLIRASSRCTWTGWTQNFSPKPEHFAVKENTTCKCVRSAGVTWGSPDNPGPKPCTLVGGGTEQNTLP